MAAQWRCRLANCSPRRTRGFSHGDAALLRFAAAIEFVEAICGSNTTSCGGQVDQRDNPNPGNPDYIAALQNLDGDMRSTSPKHR